MVVEEGPLLVALVVVWCSGLVILVIRTSAITRTSNQKPVSPWSFSYSDAKHLLLTVMLIAKATR